MLKQVKKVKENKLPLLYFCFGTLSVFLVAFILYQSLSRILIQESVSHTQNSVVQTGKYLEVYIEQLQSVTSQLTLNADVTELFSGKNIKENDFYEERIQGLIQHTLNGNSSLDTIVLISKDGKLFSNQDNLDMSMSKDMMKEAWYQQAIHNDMPILTSARMQKFSMDKDIWVISMSREITDEQGNNIGVVVIDVPYTAIESYLEDLDLGKKGYSFIFNQYNDLVFHPDVSYYQSEEKKNELLEMKKKMIGYQPGENYLISHYEIGKTDWTLVSVCSVDAMDVLKRQLLEAVILGVGLILLVVILSSLLLKKLTAQIKNQEAVAHQFEMQSLYSQINPHFLYNTLDTIVWMAEFNQKEMIIKITKSLAHFFRLSLNQGKMVTTIEDEVEHVKEYLYIQKQRYQEKLEYSIQVNKELFFVEIPKIILQPLVENAIYHGIRDKDGTGHIWIIIDKNEQGIYLLVKDDGVGRIVDNQSNLPNSSKVKLGGVGLKNIESRMQLFTGGKSNLTFVSQPKLGTSVTIYMFDRP